MDGIFQITNWRVIERTASADEYQKLRADVGWHNHERKYVQAGLNASIFFVCAMIGENLVGMGRVVGDGVIYFYIQDVVVLPEYQGRGIGSDIIRKLDQLILSRAVPGAFVGLMSAEGLQPLYERFGFSVRNTGKPGMEKWIYV